MSTQALQALVKLLSEPPDPAVVEDPVSWELIKKNAAVYGVTALAAFAARPFTQGEERAWCDQALTRNWRRHDKSLLDLQYVLGILEEAGIRALVLKGPLLARRYYQPAFLRKTSIDVDLAVREHDIERACQALVRVGYQRGKSLREAKAYSYDVGLLHASRPRVELHFRLSHWVSGLSVDEFFERAVPSLLPNGNTAWVLDGADELNHLVLHLAHHRFPVLFNLYEIRRIWRLAPPAVQEEAIRRASQNHFFAAFVMTDIAFRAVWGEPFLPPGLAVPKTWLHWRLNESLYRECVRWSKPGFKLTLANRLKGRWLDFQLTDRPSDALRLFTMYGHVAWYRLQQGGWKTLKYVHFADPPKP